MTSSKEGARPPGRRVLCSYHFLSGAQDPHLPKADVERGTLQAPIGLADDDDVDTPGQGGRVQPLVEFFHGDKHLARQLPDVIHGLSLEKKKETQTDAQRIHSGKATYLETIKMNASSQTRGFHVPSGTLPGSFLFPWNGLQGACPPPRPTAPASQSKATLDLLLGASSLRPTVLVHSILTALAARACSVAARSFHRLNLKTLEKRDCVGHL